MTMRAFLDVLDRLEKAGVPHSISRGRSDALRIEAWTPGRFWEIDVSIDGEIEVDEFIGGLDIREGPGAVDRMLEIWGEPAPPEAECAWYFGDWAIIETPQGHRLRVECRGVS